MSKYVWIVLAVAVVGLLVWYFQKNSAHTLPSGNTTPQPADLNPTVATTSYGR